MSKSSIAILGVVVLAAAGLVYLGIAADGGPAAGGQAAIMTAEDHVKGNREAMVVLVEYSDFQCPACAAYYPLVKKIAEDYANDVAIVYRHFPLQQHRQAVAAAQAAEAAANQGRFWEMHDMLFEHQGEWSGNANAAELFAGYAAAIGLDGDQYRRDVEASAGRDRAQEDFQSGRAAGVNATPTFFLNGQRIVGPQSYSEFAALLDEAIAQNR
ncbi:hypothetical protein C4552_01255 [Candidatus Parcubacteria bacterium]|nr:MAG: hypothetical protein C4552_01255 [Candidatus Parcubacteria bacterium]